MLNACINEIFSSVQGEGQHIGERMTFIRFAHCGLKCQWCDTVCTPNELCEIFDPRTHDVAQTLENPIGILQLGNILDNFSDDTLAITGGEPLEQIEFLTEFFPTQDKRRRILLETNGIYPDAFKKIASHVDVVSMDIKLPSSTGLKPYWKEHKKFLEVVLESGSEIYIKLVVTAMTSDKDLNEAIKLISSTNRYVPVFLQPVTPNDNFSATIPEEKLLSFKRLFAAWFPNVSITPQMHKTWDIK